MPGKLRARVPITVARRADELVREARRRIAVAIGGKAASAPPEVAEAASVVTGEPPPPIPGPGRAMVVMAHPDDAEFVCGGTIAKWCAEGWEVVYVVVTGGDKGTHDPAMHPEKLAAIREEEQRAACRVLGIADVVFLGYTDGVLEPTLALRRDLTRVVRRFRPDAVVCGDPTVRFYGTRYMNHPDHRVASDVTLDAVFPSAETRFIFPELLAEGLEPHHVREVWLFGSEQTDTFVDIASTLPVKIRALREHRSQMGDWDPSPMIHEWARTQGKRRRLRAAETYRRMVLED